MEGTYKVSTFFSFASCEPLNSVKFLMMTPIKQQNITSFKSFIFILCMIRLITTYFVHETDKIMHLGLILMLV